MKYATVATEGFPASSKKIDQVQNAIQEMSDAISKSKDSDLQRSFEKLKRVISTEVA